MHRFELFSQIISSKASTPAAWVYSGFFAAACVLSVVTTAFILKTQQNIGIDVPDSRRKTHEKPVSRLGGAAIFVALLFGLAIALQTRGIEWIRWWPLLICNGLVFAIGFLDDLKPLGARTKLIGQIGAATILFALGVSIDILSNPFGSGSISLGWLSLPLTVFWLVSIPNIVNLIDGMDGLATGFGMFISLTLAMVGHLSGQPDVVYVSLIMAGALGGFLVFNFPPAKIFLGDGGAYLIGFFIASVALLTSNKGSILAALLVMMVALGVPILDTLFAILRRAVRGVPIFKADAEHIHHRLIVLGYTKGQALMMMYAVCVVLSLVGISILLTKGLALPVVGAVLFLLAMAAARYLGYVRTWKGFRLQMKESMARRKDQEYVNAHARVMELEIEKCASPAEFIPILRQGLSRLGLHLDETPGLNPIEIPLANGGLAILFKSGEIKHRLEEENRIDAVKACLDAAITQWGSLPDLQVAPDPKWVSPSVDLPVTNQETSSLEL
jgi:UDP-GlcNAc:undecaprenyl-phosphate GlcNAc-1-phosphate transferase